MERFSLRARLGGLRLLLLVLPLASAVGLSCAAATAEVAETHAPADGPRDRVSLLTADQLLEILDDTVDWYRMLGTQQQNATQPSDLLLFYADRQLADKVIQLAFEIARANAELLSSEVGAAQSPMAPAGSDSPQQLEQLQRNIVQRGESIQNEMDSARRAIARAAPGARSELNAKVLELQGELEMVKAQKNLLDNMSRFVYENDPRRAGVSALKERIDALAATIPASDDTAPAPTANASGVAATASGASTRAADGTTAATRTAAARSSAGSAAASGGLGIWDLLADEFRLSEKSGEIDTVDKRTRSLQQAFRKLRGPPNEQLQRLSMRSDQLATAADNAKGQALTNLRNQFDTLAWLFTQTSAVAIPLDQEDVLLTQYRHNLDNWRATVRRESGAVLRELGIRLAILVAALGAVFIASEVARRAIIKYVREPRYRSQLLLLRKLGTWVLVALVLSLTFITHLSSFATFAGLLSAGLAVAMQSVLVSVVGYFMLIGKYGIRVGDRVQIGTVHGEVIDIGLIRMHLLELTSDGPLGPTGRVVAFANSIVFQSSGGLFRQIPGVNFTWHELTVALPAGRDYLALKEQLQVTVTAVVDAHRGEILRQSDTIKRTAATSAAADMTPQVQLQFSASAVEAKVRYPVPLNRTAEVDERVSQKLHEVLQEAAGVPRAG
jgi:small-conductance mechanosensitive channel